MNELARTLSEQQLRTDFVKSRLDRESHTDVILISSEQVDVQVLYILGVAALSQSDRPWRSFEKATEKTSSQHIGDKLHMQSLFSPIQSSRSFPVQLSASPTLNPCWRHLSHISLSAARISLGLHLLFTSLVLRTVP